MRKILFTLILASSSSLAYAEALPSLSCSFTEPFISIVSYPGGLKVMTPEGSETAKEIKLSGTHALPKLSATLKSGKLDLEVLNGQGSDGMSDFVFPQAGKLTISNHDGALQGGCTRLPDGTSPRAITTPTQDKPVGVRKGPSVKTPWVANLYEKQLFWAFPEMPKYGWVRGATAKYPPGEGGKIKVVKGHVNLKFLGPMN